MAIKIKTKSDVASTAPTTSQYVNPLKVPVISAPQARTPNIIIRALKIMLMDIRMLVHPKQTKEELENYSQFADLAYRRK
jgi:hypothetical protein